MLAIRMQRNGRKGRAFFRVIVQESRLSPTSGRVVAYIGSYDPHTKDVQLDAEKAAYYLENGAQPSDRVARLFRSQEIKLPDWVKIEDTQDRTTRNPEKLRKNQPAEEAQAEDVKEETAPAEDAEKPAEEAPKEEAASEATEEKSEEEKAPEAAEEKPEEAKE